MSEITYTNKDGLTPENGTNFFNWTKRDGVPTDPFFWNDKTDTSTSYPHIMGGTSGYLSLNYKTGEIGTMPNAFDYHRGWDPVPPVSGFDKISKFIIPADFLEQSGYLWACPDGYTYIPDDDGVLFGTKEEIESSMFNLYARDDCQPNLGNLEIPESFDEGAFIMSIGYSFPYDYLPWENNGDGTYTFTLYGDSGDEKITSFDVSVDENTGIFTITEEGKETITQNGIPLFLGEVSYDDIITEKAFVSSYDGDNTAYSFYNFDDLEFLDGRKFVLNWIFDEITKRIKYVHDCNYYKIINGIVQIGSERQNAFIKGNDKDYLYMSDVPWGYYIPGILDVENTNENIAWLTALLCNYGDYIEKDGDKTISFSYFRNDDYNSYNVPGVIKPVSEDIIFDYVSFTDYNKETGVVTGYDADENVKNSLTLRVTDEGIVLTDAGAGLDNVLFVPSNS